MLQKWFFKWSAKIFFLKMCSMIKKVWPPLNYNITNPSSFYFRTNKSSSHDLEAVHVAPDQKGRRKRVDRQAGGPRLLPAHHPPKVALHGPQAEDQDRGFASGPRISVTKFGPGLQPHEPCHAIQKSKKIFHFQYISL
jgi:hypothetical protein